MNNTFYILTTGGHEDYTVLGIFIGPEGVDIKQLAKNWYEKHPDKINMNTTKSGKEYFDSKHFEEFVLKEAGLIKFQSTELWLPDYVLDMKRFIEHE